MFTLDINCNSLINIKLFSNQIELEARCPGIRFVATTLLALTAAVGAVSASYAGDVDASLREDFERIAQRRIIFGHQSVGANILDGVKQLSKMVGVPVNIVDVKSADSPGLAMIGHTFIAENGKPLMKLKSFEQAMGLQATGFDIALVKFCYVDFTAETDAQSLFASYRATIDTLRVRHPGTTFVHITAPLTTVQDGFKSHLKRLVGNAPYGTVENLRREEYNALLRQAYSGKEPIFDLARIESIAPDGSAVTVEWKGSSAPAMSAAYTYDGGHLNAAGKLRAARELVSVLAAIPNQAATGRQPR